MTPKKSLWAIGLSTIISLSSAPVQAWQEEILEKYMQCLSSSKISTNFDFANAKGFTNLRENIELSFGNILEKCWKEWNIWTDYVMACAVDLPKVLLGEVIIQNNGSTLLKNDTAFACWIGEDAMNSTIPTEVTLIGMETIVPFESSPNKL